jgi:hypothetical protein
VSSRIWGPSKAAQIPEEENGSFREGRGMEVGWESKVSAGSTPNPSHSTKMLGKTQRKLMRKVSRPKARFNDRLELSSWLRKGGAALTLG